MNPVICSKYDIIKKVMINMKDYCMIETAFGNKEELEKTINDLLDNKLVASCQVIESNSAWNWNNKRESEKEYLLLMKSKKSLSNEIYKVIKNIHSYECFEFAIFNLTSINNDYLNWIDKETK